MAIINQRSAIRFLRSTGLFSFAERVHEKLWLSKAKRAGSYSQYGEDRFVLEYFAGKRNGTYVDVGANHPFKMSVTYLLYCQDWRGVTVEPIPELHRKHVKFRQGDIQLNCGAGETASKLQFFEMEPRVLSTFDQKVADEYVAAGRARIRKRFDIEVLTLRNIFETRFNGKPVDLLTVDVEGLDLPVLRGNDWGRFRPKLILCEANSPAHEAQTTSYLQEVGYRRLRNIQCNIVFEDARATAQA